MRACVELLLSALQLALGLLVLGSPPLAEPVAEVVRALELVPDSSGQAGNNSAPIFSDRLLHSIQG